MAKAPPKVPPVPTTESAPAPAAETSPPTIPLVDNLFAPEVYATEITGYSVSHGHVTLTLASLRASWSEPGNPNKRVVIGRVVLPVKTAQILVTELYGFLVKHDLDPNAKTPDTPIQ